MLNSRRSAAALAALTLAISCSSRPATGPIPPASSPPSTSTTPPASDPLGVSIHTLSNGLQVYISEEPSNPRISAWVAFRNGSRHDPANSTGLAHYLEHMLFKGSSRLGTSDIAKEQPHLDRIAALYDELKGAPAEKRAQILKEIDRANTASAQFTIPNEFDQLYSELGITGLNAFTSDDMTVYIADLPSNRLEAWARVEVDRFKDPKFRQFFPELETVYEEKNTALDDPEYRVYEAMMAALFPGHPYGTQPTIGTVEHLKTPAYGDMVAYFKRWYVPGNAAIVLAGDVRASEAIPILEKYFSQWPAKDLEPLSPATLPRIKGRQERTVVAQGEESVHLAWRTVPVGHPDELALEVMDLLVDNSTTGLVNLDLLLTQKLPDAGSSPEFRAESGFWQLQGTARSDQSLADVEGLLRGVVLKLQRGEFSQADIDAIVTNEEIKEKRELESRQSRVAKMAFAFIYGRDWQDVVTRLDRLRQITKEDVVRVANQYLGPHHVVVTRKRGTPEMPKIDKPSITPFSVEAGRRSAFAEEIANMPTTPLEPVWLEEGRDYQRIASGQNTRIHVVNKMNDLFSVTFDFDFGVRANPLVCLALDIADNAGTQKLSATELKRKLYALGASFTYYCGTDESSLTIRGVDRNYEESLELVRTLLAKPVFDEALLAKMVGNQISQREDRMNDPQFIQGALSEYAAYGEASSGLAPASNRALKAATPNDVDKALSQLLATPHWQLYFGPRAPTAALETIARETSAPLPPRRAMKLRALDRGTLFLVGDKVAQSKISLYFPSARLSREDELQADLYSEYVGGSMGSLIFQEIREARGLAYSAWGSFGLGDRKEDQPYAFGFLGTQTDKTVEALGKMLELLPTPPVQPERFAIAQASLVEKTRTQRIPPRFIGSTVLDWQRRGHTSDPRQAKWPRLLEATADDLRAFVARMGNAKPIISVLTDPKKVSKKQLQKFGKVVEVERNELVSYDD